MPPFEEMDLRRLCSFIWWYTTHEHDAQEVAKFKARLWQPPKGVAPDPRSPWSKENETAAFAAFQAQATGVVKPA